MVRRDKYTELQKTGQKRPDGITGQIIYKGFQCPTGGCEHWFTLRADLLASEYSFACPVCSQTYSSGETIELFDYQLVLLADSSVIEAGLFEMYVDEYVEDAPLFKYCLLCYELKPLDAFANHQGMASGRQGECRRCKTRYNGIKNQSRIADQHRDASQKRRLLVDLGGSTNFNSETVRSRFGNKCFRCGKDVSTSGAQFDHTLPARFLWPMTTENATLLCSEDNGNKSATWPGQFYSDAKLRDLALLTGIDYDLLRGEPHINPAAVAKLKSGDFVDAMFRKYAHYINDIALIRNRVFDLEGFDFFTSSTNISEVWITVADALRRQSSTTVSE